MMTHLNNKNSPNFRDMRTSDERLFIGPHWASDPGDPPTMVYPAKSMTLGTTSTESQPGVDHPCLKLYALGTPYALLFVPTADELEQMAAAMLECAQRMRDEANIAAQVALDQAAGK